MGYHVTILRTHGSTTEPLTIDEVRDVASTMDGWEYDEAEEELIHRTATEPDTVLSFGDGELWTKNPSEETLSRMITVANHLGGRVRGDEFETYRTLDDWYAHPDDREAEAQAVIASQAKFRRTNRKQWVIRAVILAPLVVGLLIKLLRGD
jgi:hypothetical protein